MDLAQGVMTVLRENIFREVGSQSTVWMRLESGGREADGNIVEFGFEGGERDSVAVEGEMASGRLVGWLVFR